MRIRHRKDKVKGKEVASDAVADSTRANPDLSGWREVHCYGGLFKLLMIEDGKAGIEQVYGGAFVLRDEGGRPLLARGFPMSPVGEVLAEAIALREAVKAVVHLGEERIVFCSSCPALVSRLIGDEPQVLGVEVEYNLRLTYSWGTWIPKTIFAQISEEDSDGVRNVARTAARSRQHLQWDGAMIQKMGWNI